MSRGILSNILFTLLLALFIGLMVRNARVSPLTYDEIYTATLSQYSSLDQLWTWLRSGTDLNPPLNYILTNTSYRILGQSPLTTRLPAILAYTGAVFLTFTFLRLRYDSEPAGWFGGLGLLVCNLPYYAPYARAYSLMMFCGASALFCWYLQHRSRTTSGRILASLGFALSLTAGMYSHYYCVLIVIPITIAEVVRFAKTYTIRWPIVIAMFAALASLIGLLPLIETARQFSAGFWRQPSWGDIEVCYGGMLPHFSFPVFLVAGTVYLTRRSPLEDDDRTHDFIPDAAILGFLLLPVFGVMLAKLGTGAFDKRYVILSYLGAVCVFAGLTHRFLRLSRLRMAIVILILAGWWLTVTEVRYRKRSEETQVTERTFANIKSHAESELVCVISAETFLSVAYAYPELCDRLIYPADGTLAMKFIRTDTTDRNLMLLAQVRNTLQIRPFTECPLKVGSIVLGDGWQRTAWERMGYRFESTQSNGFIVSRVTKLPKETNKAQVTQH